MVIFLMHLILGVMHVTFMRRTILLLKKKLTMNGRKSSRAFGSMLLFLDKDCTTCGRIPLLILWTGRSITLKGQCQLLCLKRDNWSG